MTKSADRYRIRIGPRSAYQWLRSDAATTTPALSRAGCWPFYQALQIAAAQKYDQATVRHADRDRLTRPCRHRTADACEQAAAATWKDPQP